MRRKNKYGRRDVITIFTRTSFESGVFLDASRHSRGILPPGVYEAERRNMASSCKRIGGYTTKLILFCFVFGSWFLRERAEEKNKAKLEEFVHPFGR